MFWYKIIITVTSENLENVNPNEKILESFKDKNYMNVRTFSLIKPEENIFNPFNFTNTLVANDSKNYKIWTLFICAYTTMNLYVFLILLIFL